MTMNPFDLGPHAAFILIAYGLCLLTMVSLLLWVVLDHRAQKRALADLEQRGIGRRSDRRKAQGQIEPHGRTETA
jgi:heme exporter protein D